MKRIILFSGLLLSAIFVKAQNGLENITVEKFYVSDANDSTGAADNGSGNLPAGSVTYRIYADMLPGYNFQALYGVPGHTLLIQTSTSFFNDENFGGTAATNSTTNTRKYAVLLDSYFSVGGTANGRCGVLKTEDTDGSPGNAQGMLQNTDVTFTPINIGTTTNLSAFDGMIPGTPVSATFVGINNTGNGDLGVVDALSQVGGLFTTDNGSIAALGGTTGVTAANRILIGQFTTTGCLHFELNIQIGTPGGGVENYVASNPVSGEITIPSLTGSFGPCAAPVPVADFTANNLQFCATGSTTFSDASTNNPTSWLWTFPGGTPATSTAQNPTVTYMVKGIYDVTLTATNASGDGTTTKTGYIVVDSLPVSQITPPVNQSICLGNTLTLNASSNIAPITYQWQKNNVNIPGATASSYVASQQAAYRVRITNTSNTCSKLSVPVTVFTQHPQAPISAAGNTTFCSNGSVQLQSSGAGTSTFQWLRNNITIIGATAANYSATSYGGYRVRITDNLGCSNTSASVYVTVYQNPNVTVSANGPLTFCAGQSVTLSVQSQANTAYQWNDHGAPINGATQNQYIATAGGKYTVTATNAQTCSNSSSPKNVIVNCRMASGDFTASSDMIKDDFNVYPNPADNYAQVYFNIADDKSIDISIYDMVGKKIFTADNAVYTKGSYELSLSTINLTSGIYFVRLSTNEDQQNFKLIVNHK